MTRFVSTGIPITCPFFSPDLLSVTQGTTSSRIYHSRLVGRNIRLQKRFVAEDWTLGSELIPNNSLETGLSSTFLHWNSTYGLRPRFFWSKESLGQVGGGFTFVGLDQMPQKGCSVRSMSSLHWGLGWHHIFRTSLGRFAPLHSPLNWRLTTVMLQDKFKGEMIHTSSFRSAKGNAGKRVLVIGSGTSGHDVASEHVKYGAGKHILENFSSHISSEICLTIAEVVSELNVPSVQILRTEPAPERPCTNETQHTL